MRFDSTPYTICTIDPARATLRLFLSDPTDTIYGQFRSVEAQRGSLAFGMNAGMYHDDRAPVGHYVEEGEQTMRVIPNAGPGNFGLLPNGVLCQRQGRADVSETLRFVHEAPSCDFATQSGPMLVIDGALHPRFLPDGTSRLIRNGVGTSASGDRAVFAIADQPVNFHSFARLFQEGLDLPQALYLDGNISRLYAPALGRQDPGPAMGPIVGVLEADITSR